ncbi:MAG: cold shock domain-containing protein, partial [Flavobacteriales bacterium]|nr:cold shock domain-containing protein [Flavobacteriales bacterium]
GFGFIAPDQGGQDIFVHKSGTRDDLYENDKVTFEVEQTQRGLSAINVVKS